MYAVAVITKDKVVNYYMDGKSGKFPKTVFLPWELAQLTQQKWKPQRNQ